MKRERRREPAGLVLPVAAHARGGDDDSGALLGAREEECQRLHGLPEAHVVGEAGAEAARGTARKEHEPVALVVAELRLQRARDARRRVERALERVQTLA
jgi:hypothetical protein